MSYQLLQWPGKRIQWVESEVTFGISYLPQGVHRMQPENKVFFPKKYRHYMIHILY